MGPPIYSVSFWRLRTPAAAIHMLSFFRFFFFWKHVLQKYKKQLFTLKFYVMNALKNKVQLIGNLGGKPEIKEMESGKTLATFSVATNETYRNAKGEKVTETQWHRVVAWGKVAEIALKYLDKGKEVAIEGKLVNRSYTDKGGIKRYITEVQVSELLMLGARTTSRTPLNENEVAPVEVTEPVDDLPF